MALDKPSYKSWRRKERRSTQSIALDTPWLGKLDVPHALSFVEDVAHGLLVLGTHEQALGQVWHLPTAQALTGRQYIALAGEAAGVQARPLAVPGPPLRVLGLTNPILRDSVELLYEFNDPLLFEGSKYSCEFNCE